MKPYCIVSFNMDWQDNSILFRAINSISCQPMLKPTTSMNHLESDMSNSTNTVVQFDEKGINLCLRLSTRSHIIYAPQVGCICHPRKFEKPIIHQHELLWRKSLIGGTAVTTLLCLHAGPMRGVQSIYWSGVLTAKKGLWISEGLHSLSHRRLFWCFHLRGGYFQLFLAYLEKIIM